MSTLASRPSGRGGYSVGLRHTYFPNVGDQGIRAPHPKGAARSGMRGTSRGKASSQRPITGAH
ncbi:hypothetical protein FH610_015915 [Microbispora catharanthi]|uniref:Uncharacterized protein n=1 Tax=Microbispora catharanthi TaxID=1712871 RepID=A0A5N6BWC3_9ACTN|nr:hypothetical protein FH610_015915 [Microbispora catharanthi]